MCINGRENGNERKEKVEPHDRYSYMQACLFPLGTHSSATSVYNAIVIIVFAIIAREKMMTAGKNSWRRGEETMGILYIEGLHF